MMSPTHIGVGLLLAAPLLAIAPGLAPAAALGGVAGAILPDLDLFVGEHRRTLHFPVYYWLPAALAVGAAVISPGPLTVAAAVCFVSAGVHSVMDWFGAGDETKPWQRTSTRAVYVHPKRLWLRPKYWIRYDGAPEDVALATVLLLPGLFVYGPTVRQVTIVCLCVALAYGLFRKQLPRYFGDLL
ncbi:metal-dependent hydrolase [Haloferacaceae archaeon DSL9]